MSATKILATASMPCWQHLEGETEDAKPVAVRVEQNAGYGGISIIIGAMEVYVENDANKGIAVYVWKDKDSGNDADAEIAFPINEIMIGG